MKNTCRLLGYFGFLLILLLACVSAHAQTTNITLQVTDTNGRAWAGGTWQATLVTLPGQNPFGPPFFNSGTTTPVPNQNQSGTLSATGSATMTLTQNAGVAPSGSKWKFSVCLPPISQTGCFTQFVTITAATTVTLNPAPPNPPVGTTGAPSLVTNGLLADYRFSEGSGAITSDTTGTNSPLTLVNSPAWIAGGGVSCVSGSSQSITVPASLNGAATIEIYASVQYANFGNNTDKAIIIGDGGGGTAGTTGLIMDTASSTTFAAGLLQSADFATVKNGTLTQNRINSWNGTGLMTWVLDASTDFFYQNGQVAGFRFADTADQGAQTTGSYHLCGQPAGSGFATATFITANIYWVRFFSTELTAQQVQQDFAAMATIEAAAGSPINMAATDQTPMSISVGDSLTSGTGTNIPYVNAQVLNNGMSIALRAQGAQTAEQDNAQFASTYAPMYRPAASHSVYEYWACTNDAPTSTTAQQCSGLQRQFCAQVHTSINNSIVAVGETGGAKCILFTMISRTGGFDTFMATLNPFTRGLVASGYADSLVDVGADPILAPSLAGVSACFQGDGLHYTTGCAYNHISPLANAAVNSLFGHWSFSTATTYTAVGGAAVATTSGAESGTTITFGAASFPAATFAVGTRMVCSGITPAAYNGVWTIVTNFGTGITVVTDTSGLGAITVQGTCQGEQLQQADNYAILNNGGNFLLPSCLDWVGPSLIPGGGVHLWNINGVASTLVVFNSETFVGSTSVASNSVAILQSVLTSNTTGGCKWLRIQ